MTLYVGAPGSGKTTAARNECDFVIDDPDTFDVFQSLMKLCDATRVGVTVPYITSVSNLHELNAILSGYDAFIQEIVVFDGSKETLLHNVRLRGDADTKPVFGAIHRWTFWKYAEILRSDLTKSGAFHFSVRKVKKYG